VRSTLAEPLLPLAEVARRLSVSPRTVRRLVDAGELSSFRVGGQVRIESAALAAYLARRARPVDRTTP
jgi:excisionase family DNA binding protein